MTKKKRFGNLKNLLKALQQFLSFPTCLGRYEPPKKNAILISSDRKNKNSIHKTKMYLQQKK